MYIQQLVDSQILGVIVADIVDGVIIVEDHLLRAILRFCFFQQHLFRLLSRCVGSFYFAARYGFFHDGAYHVAGFILFGNKAAAPHIASDIHITIMQHFLNKFGGEIAEFIFSKLLRRVI